MLCDTKAKCTFRRSKTFFAAKGLRASNLDHNNAYNSITVHWFAGNRAPCKWFSIGFILGLLWAVGLYDCQQKTVWHKRALCKTACAVFSTPWNILMTLSARRAGSSHRDPTLETVGTDLNNPHFSRSPGGFHAHLLTAGVRSCCPFSTSLTLTETHTHTHTDYSKYSREMVWDWLNWSQPITSILLFFIFGHVSYFKLTSFSVSVLIKLLLLTPGDFWSPAPSHLVSHGVHQRVQPISFLQVSLLLLLKTQENRFKIKLCSLNSK